MPPAMPFLLRLPSMSPLSAPTMAPGRRLAAARLLAAMALCCGSGLALPHARDAAGPAASAAVVAASPPASAPTAPPAAPAGAPPPPSTEDFARLPLLEDLELSPDGKRIAGLMNIDDQTVLITRPADGNEIRTVLKTDNQRFHFRWIHWVGNDRLVASVGFAARRYFVGTQETRLLSVRADGTGLIELVKAAPFGRGGTAQIQDAVVDWLPDDGRHILLQLPDENGGAPAVFRVDVETGRRHMVHAPQRNVWQWITDASHRVRVGVRSDEGEYEILACDPEGKNWRTLWKFKGRAREAVWPLGFGRQPQELYVLADHQGRSAIFTVDLGSADLKRTLRLAHPEHDLDGHLMHSPATGDVTGLRSDGVDADGEARTEIWDPQWRALAVAIDKGLPERSNRLRRFSRDEQRYIVHSTGNGQPGQYYLGDRKTGELVLLADQHGQLDPQHLAGKQFVEIRARDGLKLAAYLSLPDGASRPANAPPRPRKLPLVLLPHGGPHARDNADFDVETEFLASRGYAVLQVNFRGSWGYGHDFMAAGLQRWGLEMQDDLTDAAQWAVDQGVADPARMCIVGSSYGGYAALMGVVKTPRLFRCAASFAGVTDLIDLIQHHGDYIGGTAAMREQLGSAWGDRARLRATSPALQAERIEVPVLLVHGTADRSVPVEQSRDMAKALRSAGKPHRYIEQQDGDHHLSRYTHRLEYYRALEAFLAEHLGPPAQQRP
jgi:dipeptidyl aminopeptidase/acylaminoacyl peptidase